MQILDARSHFIVSLCQQFDLAGSRAKFALARLAGHHNHRVRAGSWIQADAASEQPNDFVTSTFSGVLNY
jgi:hypothetical protein